MGVLGMVLDVKGYHNYKSSMNGLGASLVLVGCFLCIIAKVAQDRARRAESTDSGERPASTSVRRSNRMVRTIGMALVLGWDRPIRGRIFYPQLTPCIYGLLAAFLGVFFVRVSFDRVLSPGTGDDEVVPGR